jgi:hypothetical protein
VNRALLLATASLLVAAPGDAATATYRGRTLALTLRYEMICGRPGRGPLVVRLPPSFRLAAVRVRVKGVRRPAAVAGTTVTVQLPKPPQLTCMSISEGVLPVAIVGVHAPPGRYVVRATVNAHAFAAPLRVA